MTPQECLARAGQCETDSETAQSSTIRRLLKHLAVCWRTFASLPDAKDYRQDAKRLFEAVETMADQHMRDELRAFATEVMREADDIERQGRNDAVFGARRPLPW